MAPITAEDEFGILSRELDHLGNLKRVLAELSGVATLTHELIQNADDARASTLFRATAERIEVWNDSDFSSCYQLARPECPWLDSESHRCDFHSFRRIGSGEKQQRFDTTGATERPEFRRRCWDVR